MRWLDELVESGESLALLSLTGYRCDQIDESHVGDLFDYTLRERGAPLGPVFKYRVLQVFGCGAYSRAIAFHRIDAPRRLLLAFRGVRARSRPQSPSARASTAHKQDVEALCHSLSCALSWLPHKAMRLSLGIVRYHGSVWAHGEKCGPTCARPLGEAAAAPPHDLCGWLERRLAATGDDAVDGVVFVGLSLGAAVAQMTALRAQLHFPAELTRERLHVLGFGAPCWANGAAAELYGGALGGRSVQLVSTEYRRLQRRGEAMGWMTEETPWCMACEGGEGRFYAMDPLTLAGTASGADRRRPLHNALSCPLPACSLALSWRESMQLSLPFDLVGQTAEEESRDRGSSSESAEPTGVTAPVGSGTSRWFSAVPQGAEASLPLSHLSNLFSAKLGSKSPLYADYLCLHRGAAYRTALLAAYLKANPHHASGDVTHADGREREPSMQRELSISSRLDSRLHVAPPPRRKEGDAIDDDDAQPALCIGHLFDADEPSPAAHHKLELQQSPSVGAGMPRNSSKRTLAEMAGDSCALIDEKPILADVYNDDDSFFEMY